MPSNIPVKHPAHSAVINAMAEVFSNTGGMHPRQHVVHVRSHCMAFSHLVDVLKNMEMNPEQRRESITLLRGFSQYYHYDGEDFCGLSLDRLLAEAISALEEDQERLATA